jgi:hypothetical protein
MRLPEIFQASIFGRAERTACVKKRSTGAFSGKARPRGGGSGIPFSVRKCDNANGAFSGKVESGFPSENATMQK